MAGRLVANHISKRFGTAQALDDVSIEFEPGEIHAVLGENGAGKSTLMHILSGFMNPSSGEVTLSDSLVPLGNPHKCRKAGIEMVHQHFTLVPNFTVQENLALAKMDRLATFLDVAQLAAPALSLSRNLGWQIEANAKVGLLPVGVQQRIEILKCLSGDATVLIFDEPTAVLSPDEVLDLIRVLKQLKEEGKIVILIAHKLSEVMASADRVTVLRAGKKVASAAIAEVDEAVLAGWMVGEIPQLAQKGASRNESQGLVVSNLHVRGDRGEQAVRGISLMVRQGEILGVGGVDGNGQVELAEAVALVRKITSGDLLWKESALAATAARIAYIPQDRQQDGLALDMSVQDNLFIGGQSRRDLKYGPFLSGSRVRSWANSLIERFDIRVSNPRQPVAVLSGGNQQKLVVSRNLDERPDLIVAVNPTRGLDVRATQFVHQQILAMRTAGVAIVLLSTDLDELTALSDRIAFMSRGQLTEDQGATSLVGGTT
jgi:general nucleoside transport system ATP-binding protein